MSTWTDAYTLGYARGQQDGTAEHAGTYRRDPSHQGHAGEPPGDLNGRTSEWVDGFLEGYGHGRGDVLGGAA